MSNHGAWGYIDKSGTIIIEPRFAEANHFCEGLARIRLEKQGRWGFIDTAGRMTVPPRFDKARGFSEGMAAVEIAGKWGFIGVDGEFTIPPVFTGADDFHEGLALVSCAGEEIWRYIDRKGETVIGQSDLLYQEPFSDGLALVSFYDSQTCRRLEGYIDKNGTPVIAPRFDYADSFREGLASVEEPPINGIGFIDRSGVFVIDNRYPYAGSFHEGRAIAVKRYAPPMSRGFIDRSGVFVIEPQFDWVHDFREGVAWFKRDEKYGFIDRNGDILFEDYFYYLGDLFEGLAGVSVHGRFGFINADGEVVISPQFGGISRFSNGLALFKRAYGGTRRRATANVSSCFANQGISSDSGVVSPLQPRDPSNMAIPPRIGPLAGDIGHVSRISSFIGIDDLIEPYAIGDVIAGRYEVFDIHYGGMGVVYAVFDRISGQRRAVKTLQRRFAKDIEMRELFEKEAMIWVKIGKHPYITRAYAVEIIDEQPYVSAEYVGSPQVNVNNLANLMDKYTFEIPGAVIISQRLAQGMQHATRVIPGLVHRDLKPANILIDDFFRPKITDFGLAHAARTCAGTPAYMAPEQWLNNVLSQRTDIYSFGCILYEMFTGTWTFNAKSIAEWCKMHLEESPIYPHKVNPAVPHDLSGLVMRCLSKDPASRPASWDEIAGFFVEWYKLFIGRSPTVVFSENRTVAELLTASHSFFTIKRYREMLDMCDRIIAIDPSTAGAWSNRGLALLEIGRYNPDNHRKALASFDRALDLDPHFINAWMGKLAVYNECDSRGQPAYDTTDYGKKRIECCDAILALLPDHLNALKIKAHELYLRGLFSESAEVYGRLLALDPDDCHSLAEMAEALRNAGKRREAVECFARLLLIDKYKNKTWAKRELDRTLNEMEAINYRNFNKTLLF